MSLIEGSGLVNCIRSTPCPRYLVDPTILLFLATVEDVLILFYLVILLFFD